MTKEQKAKVKLIEDIARDRHAALAVVGHALAYGYLDELFADREARDGFIDAVRGIHIRLVVDELAPGGVILDDGSIYRNGALHPPSQVIPFPEPERT